MDRLEELRAELDARGWLAGTYHQNHHPEGVSLALGEAGRALIALWPVPDKREIRHRDGRITQMAEKGEGFGLVLVTSTEQTPVVVATAAAAVDQLEGWRRKMAPGLRRAFDRAVALPERD